MRRYYRAPRINIRTYTRKSRPKKPKYLRNVPGYYSQIRTYSRTTESELEQKVITFLKEQGYEYTFGKDWKRTNKKEILLLKELKKYLSDPEIEEIVINYLTELPKDVNEAHALIWDYIQNGIWLESLNKRVFLIDFNNPNKNCFRAVNQLNIRTKTKTRIPDVIIYINGIPLVVFELKTPKITSVILQQAYYQLAKTYLRNIPELFKYAMFLVISNDYSHKYGTIHMRINQWHSWSANANKLDDLLIGLFNKETLIDYIKNYIYIFDNNTTDLIGEGGYERINTVIKKLTNEISNDAIFCKINNYYETIVLFRIITNKEEFKNYSIIWFIDKDNKAVSEIASQITKFIKVNTKVFNKEELQASLESDQIYLTSIQEYLKAPFVLTKAKNVICFSNIKYPSIELKKKILIMRIKNFFRLKNKDESIYFHPKHKTFLDYLKVACPNAIHLVKTK